jgi:hypothetical protein
MNLHPRKLIATAALGITAIALMAQYGGSGDPWWEAGSGRAMPMFSTFPDSTGDITIVNMEGPISTRNHPFFEDRGINGRACITCHQPSNAMGLSTERLRQQYEDSRGKDPVFAAIDGSNCPSLPQSDPASHSLLLKSGLFRIPLQIPANADYKIEVAADPTTCNTSAQYGLAKNTVSVYRRPRVVANLKYVLGTDGAFHLNSKYKATLAADGRDVTLDQQAAEAMHAHEQTARALTKDELQQILDFESQVFVAQSADAKGGDLTEVSGPLGAWTLGFTKHIPTGPTQPIFLEASYWTNATRGNAGHTPQTDFRESVARGNAIFMNRSFHIREVAGMPGGPTSGTCASCHTTPLTGSNLDHPAMDTGTTAYATLEEAKAATPTLPIFKLTCNPNAAPHPYLGRTIYTTDPGRALTTGRCADTGSIVMQQLRGLSARAPYFTNGQSKTLAEVVNFYDTRFDIRLTDQEKQDLINFLSVL